MIEMGIQIKIVCNIQIISILYEIPTGYQC